MTPLLACLFRNTVEVQYAWFLEGTPWDKTEGWGWIRF